MSDMKLISEVPINTYQLKKELEKIKKRDGELNLRAARTEEYLQQFCHLKKTDEIFDAIIKLNIPRLKEHHVNKIIDLNPATVNDLKVILQGYTVSVSNESMKKVVDTINEFSAKN